MENEGYEKDRSEGPRKTGEVKLEMDEQRPSDETAGVDLSDSRLEISVDQSEEPVKNNSFFNPPENPLENTQSLNYDSSDKPHDLELPGVDMSLGNIQLGDFHSHHRSPKTWFGGCFEPFLNYFVKRPPIDEQWEIPFVDIHDLRFIGSGTQGAVFAGKWKNRDIAVKKVRDLRDTDVRHLCKLKHRNIVELIGVSTQVPCFAIIMELCPYGQLYDVLASQRSLPSSLIWDWMHQVASGMHFLHTHRIVHRDLKSPNILVGHNYVLKISDFGNARTMGNDVSTRMSFAGTVAWMAPEVVRNEPCSDKVDVWSFGVIVWELLTGATPYLGIESAVLIMGIGFGRFVLPVPQNMPDGCKLLMTQCWNSKPRNRPTFRQILMHLEILSDELLNSPRFSTEEEFHRARNDWCEAVARVTESQPPVDGTAIMKQQLMNGSLLTEGWIDAQQAELVKRREEELRHVTEIRQLYEEKLRRVQALYLDLSSCMLSARERETELERREADLRREANRLRNQALVAGGNNGNLLSIFTSTPPLSQQMSLPPASLASTEKSDDSMVGRFSSSAGAKPGAKQRMYDQNSAPRPLSALNLFGSSGQRERSATGKKFVRRSFAAADRPRSAALPHDQASGSVFTVLNPGASGSLDFSQSYHDYGPAFSLPTKLAVPLSVVAGATPVIAGNTGAQAAAPSPPSLLQRTVHQGSTHPITLQTHHPQQSHLATMSLVLPSPVAEEDFALTDQEELVKEMKRQLSGRSLARLAAQQKAKSQEPNSDSTNNINHNGGKDNDSGVLVSPGD